MPSGIRIKNAKKFDIAYLLRDGERGIAILIVLSFHLAVSRGARMAFPDLTLSQNIICHIFMLNWIGVDLFCRRDFLLVVSYSITGKYSNFYSVFSARCRPCRILPLYIVLLRSFAMASAPLTVERRYCTLRTPPSYIVLAAFIVYTEPRFRIREYMDRQYMVIGYRGTILYFEFLLAPELPKEIYPSCIMRRDFNKCRLSAWNVDLFRFRSRPDDLPSCFLSNGYFTDRYSCRLGRFAMSIGQK